MVAANRDSGRRRALDLGGYPAIVLAEARAFALANKTLVTAGRDPLAEHHRANVPIFREAAKKVYEANLSRWRNGKHTVNWWGSLERHAFPVIGDVKVDRIRRSDVLAVLEPIWAVRPETARRVRQRIRTILRWCEAHDYCAGTAAGEVLNGALPPMPRLKARHHRASPYLSRSDRGVGDGRSVTRVPGGEAMSSFPCANGCAFGKGARGNLG